jgi:hypothetical protein
VTTRLEVVSPQPSPDQLRADQLRADQLRADDLSIRVCEFPT